MRPIVSLFAAITLSIVGCAAPSSEDSSDNAGAAISAEAGAPTPDAAYNAIVTKARALELFGEWSGEAVETFDGGLARATT